MRAFVLVKDESANLGRSIPPLVAAGVPVVVLDSGSADGSQALAASFGAGVEVVAVEYRSHAESYNLVLTRLAGDGEWILILDADMVVSPALLAAVRAGAGRGAAEVLAAPIEMWWAGHRLARGSLCPPKAIAFRAGRALFEPLGHGERLVAGTRAELLPVPVVHDDRKPFAQTLASQVRYGTNLAERAAAGQVGQRDRIRSRWPLFVALTPFWTYVVKRGFLAGRVGLIYAVDRLIAEAILYRQCLVARLGRGEEGRGTADPEGEKISRAGKGGG